jgi:hypothetical protein
MTGTEDLGHEPEQTHDEDFAPVTRGSDARGRTVAGERNEPGVSGTGVPGVTQPHPDSGPTDEQGVRRAEHDDASRDHPENDWPESG